MGLSGVLHGAIAAGLIAWWRYENRALTLSVAIAADAQADLGAAPWCTAVFWRHAGHRRCTSVWRPRRARRSGAAPVDAKILAPARLIAIIARLLVQRPAQPPGTAGSGDGSRLRRQVLIKSAIAATRPANLLFSTWIPFVNGMSEGLDQSLLTSRIDSMSFAVRFPWSRLAIGRHAGGARRGRTHRGADLCRSIRGARLRLVAAVPERARKNCLGSTERTQPAMLAAGVATWRVWQKHGGGMPAAMAGHSSGSTPHWCVPAHWTSAPPIALVQFRGQAMQAAVPVGQGAMAALLGLDDDAVEAACAEAAQGEVVQAANYNSPGQVVIAGAAAAVDRAIELAKARGAKRAMKLSVSVPSHSALMRPAAEQLAQRLAQHRVIGAGGAGHLYSRRSQARRCRQYPWRAG